MCSNGRSGQTTLTDYTKDAIVGPTFPFSLRVESTISVDRDRYTLNNDPNITITMKWKAAGSPVTFDW
jgi:hypothetical protein